MNAGGPNIYIGTAGWSLPKQFAAEFPSEGSHLVRYATRLLAVEINSSFYRPHRAATYEKWRASVPSDFRFSVKVPKWITHERRLDIQSSELTEFVQQVGSLGDALCYLLVQLPPSLEYNSKIASRFFKALRAATTARIACEPRHRSWFEADAHELLVKLGVTRVAADPAVVDIAAHPGGADRSVYFRLHGSPVMYYSVYDEPFMRQLSARLQRYQSQGIETWCIFDNTAAGGAIANALELIRRLNSNDSPSAQLAGPAHG